MSDPLTFAIVGASLAGVRAAETLRGEGFAGRIVLIGDEPQLPYDRPPLSKQALTGQLPPEATTLHPREFYDQMGIELLIARRAMALHPSCGLIELDDGTTVRADKVLLATGGRARRLSVAGGDREGVHCLRTPADARSIAEALEPGASVVVIGAGFVGAEVAASAREVGCDVTMIEAAPLPLRRVLGEDIARRLAAEHRRRGVDLRTGTEVRRIVGDHHVRSVETSDGESFPTDVVIVGVGIEPNSELAGTIGLRTENGIHVDDRCITANPAVYAAGDVANHPSAALGRRVRHEQWQHALDHATTAAKSMLGKAEPHMAVPWFWSDQYDLNIQLAGYPELGDDVIWRGELDSDCFCAFSVRDGSITGAVAVNRPKDVRAAMTLTATGARVSEEQLADPTVDLRTAILARAR